MGIFTPALLTVLSVDLLATSGDVTLSWTSPMYPKLYSNDSSINPIGRPITEDEDAWIGSLLNLGAFLGPLVFSLIAETFGRKIGLLAIGIPHIISYLTMAFAKNVHLFYFARFIGGLAVGGGYCLLPMYIAEIAKETERGTLSQTINVFWSIGNFLPYAVGPFISIKWFNSILAAIPITFFITFSIFGSESPFYYVKKNRIEEAEKTLMHLRSQTKEEVQEELEDLDRFCNFDRNGSLLDIIKDKVTRKSLIICLVLIATQELSGFCAITFHLQLIFDAAGTKIGAEYSALIIGIAIIFSSFMAPLLIDRAGRRFLTISSCFGMFCAHILLGTFFYIHDSTNINFKGISWVPIFSLILYIFSFNFGICSVPWTLISEIFPSNAKEVATFFISSVCWIISFTTTSYFNSMISVLGRSGTFWFFATACLVSATFAIIYVPETKGKSFLEIQEMLYFDTSDYSKVVKDDFEADIRKNHKIKLSLS